MRNCQGTCLTKVRVRLCLLDTGGQKSFCMSITSKAAFSGLKEAIATSEDNEVTIDAGPWMTLTSCSNADRNSELAGMSDDDRRSSDLRTSLR